MASDNPVPPTTNALSLSRPTSSAIFREVSYLSSPANLVTLCPISFNSFSTSLDIELTPPAK
ncbi:hypothetical protein CDFC105_104132 [Clostridioides difficile]|nr:hypothetical protein CDFC105_104132 [Clostridioides difficile]